MVREVSYLRLKLRQARDARMMRRDRRRPVTMQANSTRELPGLQQNFDYEHIRSTVLVLMQPTYSAMPHSKCTTPM